VESQLAPSIVPLPSLEQQSVEQAQWVQIRKSSILPNLMKEYNISMWILLMQEYAEDTVFWSIKSPTTFSARRRTAYLFYFLNDSNFSSFQERQFVGLTETFWKEIVSTVENVNPKNIAINIDETFAFADGLHSGQNILLMAALANYTSRIVKQPLLSLDYIALRPHEMLPRYKEIMQTVHSLISTAFSYETIIPGSTTTSDVQWWLRQRVQDLGMTVWFHPSVEILGRFNSSIQSGIIQKGDLLWCDFGVVAMGLATDTQHLGYVLKDDEDDVPDGLKNGLSVSNKLQDIVRDNLRPGRTGNEVLQASLFDMKAAGISGTVYSHPIGDFGHSAGPIIGLWDMQDGVPIRGDVKVRSNTWFSVELEATSAVPEWNGKLISFRQEEDVFIDENGKNDWVYSRQDTFWIIRSPESEPKNTILGIVAGVVIGLGLSTVILGFLAYIACYARRRSQTDYEELSQ